MYNSYYDDGPTWDWNGSMSRGYNTNAQFTYGGSQNPFAVDSRRNGYVPTQPYTGYANSVYSDSRRNMTLQQVPTSMNLAPNQMVQPASQPAPVFNQAIDPYSNPYNGGYGCYNNPPSYVPYQGQTYKPSTVDRGWDNIYTQSSIPTTPNINWHKENNPYAGNPAFNPPQYGFNPNFNVQEPSWADQAKRNFANAAL